MADLIEEKSLSRVDINNIEDLNAILVDRKFGRPQDYIEIFILDLNNTILYSIPNFKQYNTGKNTQGLTDEINIDPLSLLNGNGFFTGTYKIHVNIQKRKIFNTTTPAFRIKEITGTRTELSLATLEGGNTSLDTNSQTFISQIQNSTYFRDFTLNFGENKNITAVNIDIDRSNPNEFLLNIKLLKPLPGSFKEGDKLNIVEDITEPIVMTYDLGALPPVDTTTTIKGPNFKIDTRLNSSVPTAFKSYDDILLTKTTSSYQKLISKLDGYEIPEIDYSYVRPVDSSSIDFETVTPSHFENFVHFGSSVELLKNFQYKLKLIELYDTQLSELYNIPGGTSVSTITTEATSSILNKKENLIQGFSGYEQFLYFTTGSNPYTWPKTGNTQPYPLSHTTSSEAILWLGTEDSFHQDYGGQLLSASTFDNQNPNRLFKLTPTYIGDKPVNRPFEIFCDMVGEQFDPIWTHIKEITQIRDNSHTLGISKDLVYYALESLGIEAFDQFENEDLIGYIFGNTLVPDDTSAVITATTDITSKQDLTKEIWKRLYHNAPYLLKTKGTERGLRALINCYGIPATLLDIKEFGSSNPNRDDVKLYTYEKFTQVLTGDSLSGDKQGMFLQTTWTSSFSNALSASAKTVEFRVKPNRSNNKQHLFSLTTNEPTTISGSDLHLLIEPYTGSEDIYIIDDRTQYGRLNLHQFTSSIAETEYFPLYNKNFWDITLSTDGISGSNSTLTFGAYQSTHLREVLFYTQSVSITEQANAESFGNPYYNGGTYGTANAFIGGIKDTITDQVTTSSFYTNNVTSSFDLGYNGALSELRYYFGEQLSHETLKLHALEPLLYGGNSISSSYDHLILRYPLSFELTDITETDNQLPSSSYLWNVNPTLPLVGPITGGAILSSSGFFSTGSSYSGQPFSGSNPYVFPPSGSTFANSVIFTVAGTPLLKSHHPNQNIEYLEGFTYFLNTDVELLNETHHLPTPNTIGKSPLNQKVYIDSGSTDDDILSPDILSQLPITERQVPDFNNIGVFLSPQNEINEDIIYTLGTFSLDEFLGDPREETLDTYTSFGPLFRQYFKKLEKGKDRYNIWDFTRWMQFLDHTLFELIKKFTPQKSIDKTGLLIEPHFLERPKFKRHHPITSRPEYDGTIQEVTQSFSKNNNRSQLDNTTGSAVLSYIGTKIPVTGINPATTAIIFKNGVGAINGTITLIDASGVSKTYIAINSGGNTAGTINGSGQIEFIGSFSAPNSKAGSLRAAIEHANGHNGSILVTLDNQGGSTNDTLVLTQATAGTSGNTTVTTGGNFLTILDATPNNFSGGTSTSSTDKEDPYNTTIDVAKALSGSSTWEQGPLVPNSTGSVKQRNSSGSNALRPWTLTPRGNFMNSKVSKKRFKTYTSGGLETGPGILTSIEFDDELIDSIAWKRSRYEGSRLTGAKINEYTAGDITYGLNPVASLKSSALYFGKTLIGAEGTEDDSLVTIKNHSYVNIEKVLLINKYSDDVTIIDLKNETYKGINGYIAKDFKDGSGFNLELLDDKITHKLKDTYKAKFNQGYLYKVVEHKGINGTGNIYGEGIQVGYIDSSSADLFSSYVGTSQNVLCYGNANTTINSDTLILKSNTLTKKIWPIEQSFGLVDFVTSSANYVYSSMQNLGSFINSMLIPVASESQYRLFGTSNLGQPINVADYSTKADAGIRSISTYEFDLEKYNISSSSTLHTEIEPVGDMKGFGKQLLHPHSYVIPIMQGPHDIITTKKTGAGITWPGNGGATGGHAGTSNGKIELQYYFSGDAHKNAIYQLSYLEETNTLITDIDKPTELAEGIGDEGYILIPDNLDKDIKNNLKFFLEKVGMAEGAPERVPNKKE